MSPLVVIAGLVFVTFFMIVFRGAPFVPTRAGDIEELFSLYNFKKNDVLVDLGSGDGRVLSAAANRGVTAVGYELNPFLVLYSRFNLRHTPSVTVKLEDFWLSKLPERSAVVFVFLAGPFMKKLDRKLRSEAVRLGRDLTLVSYGVHIPGKTPEKEQGAFVTYRYKH